MCRFCTLYYRLLLFNRRTPLKGDVIMTVKELKENLNDVPDDTMVLTATDEEWNGFNDYLGVFIGFCRLVGRERDVVLEDDVDAYQKQLIDNKVLGKCVIIG